MLINACWCHSGWDRSRIKGGGSNRCWGHCCRCVGSSRLVAMAALVTIGGHVVDVAVSITPSSSSPVRTLIIIVCAFWWRCDWWSGCWRSSYGVLWAQTTGSLAMPQKKFIIRGHITPCTPAIASGSIFIIVPTICNFCMDWRWRRRWSWTLATSFLAVCQKEI